MVQSRDTSREYPKCLYRNGIISDHNIDVLNVDAEIEANKQGFWDCVNGKVLKDIYVFTNEAQEQAILKGINHLIDVQNSAIEQTKDIENREHLADDNKKPRGRPRTKI